MSWIKSAKKALGALLGAATGVAVVQVLELFGVAMDLAVANAIAVVLATIGTYLAPANEIKE